MARFEIQKFYGISLLMDYGLERGIVFLGDEAIELRDLLLREFPVMRPCRCQVTPAKGPEHPQPAQSEPDPDEVRQALDFFEPLWVAEPARMAIANAARAYLRDREQPKIGCRATGPKGYACTLPGNHEGDHEAHGASSEPPYEAWSWRHPSQQPTPAVPTIAQVIEARGDCAHLLLRRHSGGGWTAEPARYTGCHNYTINDTPQVQSITPEAALHKLYDDAIAKLKQQRDEADAKLEKLGVQS